MRNTDEITGDEDILTSDHVIARHDYLKDLVVDDDGAYLPDVDEDLKAEYDDLSEVVEQGEQDVPDWNHAETLIRDDHFTEYYEEYTKELEYSIDWTSFPFRHMNWEDVADEAIGDYTQIEIMGTTYYARS